MTFFSGVLKRMKMPITFPPILALTSIADSFSQVTGCKQYFLSGKTHGPDRTVPLVEYLNYKFI